MTEEYSEEKINLDQAEERYALIVEKAEKIRAELNEKEGEITEGIDEFLQWVKEERK